MIKSVFIDAVEYKIETTDKTIVVDGHECAADVDYVLALIRIRDENIVGDGARAKILMHEIMHALLNERGMTEAADNEQLVDALASGFVNLIRANTDLVEYIITGSNHEEE